MPTKKVSSEALFYGEACGCGPGTHSELVVDGVEVPVDGARTAEQARYLAAGDVAGFEAKFGKL
jgi:hypothetical protein